MLILKIQIYFLKSIFTILKVVNLYFRIHIYYFNTGYQTSTNLLFKVHIYYFKNSKFIF